MQNLAKTDADISKLLEKFKETFAPKIPKRPIPQPTSTIEDKKINRGVSGRFDSRRSMKSMASNISDISTHL